MDISVVNNDSLADEEIDVLSAIYGDEFSILDPDNRLYMIQIISDVQSKKTISLTFQQLPGYPKHNSINFELKSSLNSEQIEVLRKNLHDIVALNHGTPFVYMLVESARSYLQTDLVNLNNPEPQAKTIESNPIVMQQNDVNCIKSLPSVQYHLKNIQHTLPISVGATCPPVYHGEPFIDRKSVFQAHCARVLNMGEVSCFISELLKNHKIAEATHNILAYRITMKEKEKSIVVSDCDDDGETHAGGRLLHLLTISNVQNVVVLVSRWYGGVQLGPDRFKHINNVARSILSDIGLLSASSSSTISTSCQEKKNNRAGNKQNKSLRKK